MAVMANGKVRRHKDAGGEWCSGLPKVSFELMLEVLTAVSEERAIIGELVDAFSTYSDVLLDCSERFAEARTRTSALIQQTTERIHAEVALLKDRNDSLVAHVDI